MAILGLLNSEWFVWFNWVLSIVTTVAFFAYCLSREGRDEHGRAIIGTACMYGTVVLFILINILGLFSRTVITNLAIFSNCLRLVFNGYFITVLICIAILRKLR
ncbi:MAG: hypothetical protein K2O45_02950 [Oscillospiraceae bacterium]|nr:hypothetical protein [Oscillospiraceae bacterium]